jgi:uncharacterized repeat protein (TIGR03987 family)
MSPIAKIATTVVLLALVCYTTGVFASLIKKGLQRWHMIIYWIGITLDMLGTAFMAILSGGFKLDSHGITGIIAFVCMLANACGATVVLKKNNETQLRRFPFISLIIWLIWLSSVVTAAKYYK